MDLRAAEEVEQYGEPTILEGAAVIQHSRENTGQWTGPVLVRTPHRVEL